ncbi:MAG: HAMP domain-containing histidine kinase [Helicobacteraceae bacterium]|nr:HAMP domain-containing histidine kinase [Helicobacteraceae bacterium]
MVLILFIANIFFFVKTDSTIRDIETKRLKDEILFLAQSLVPYYLNGNIDYIYKIGDNFGFTNLDKVPKNADVIYKESNQIITLRIFVYGSNIGFSIIFLDNEIHFVKQIGYSVWDKYKIILLLFQVSIIILLFLFFFYQVMRPLDKLKDAINELKDGIYAKKLIIKSSDEIGLLFKSFNEMNEKISRMVKARELITRNIAHELRTPLAKISFALTLQEGENLKRDLKRYIDSLNRISHTMLEYERLQADGFSIKEDEIFSDRPIFEAIKEMDRSKINLNIIKTIKIKGDLHLLSIAIKNIAENAIKYSNNGLVFIELNEQGIVFYNNGIKLQKDISYYFEPFYRGDITKNGYGIGLSIVKEILTLHKMSIDYQYDGNKHIFYIRFHKETQE